MATAQPSGTAPRLPRWWTTALLIGVGGAIFAFLVLWLAQVFASGSRLLESSWTGLVSVGLTALLLSVLSWLALNAAPLRRGLAWQIVLVWLGGYVLIWLIGAGLHGVSLPVYLLFWLALGTLAAWQLDSAPPGRQAAPARTATRAGQAVARTSQFGRVPADTVVLMTQLVRQTRGSIVSALPDGTPPAVWEWTTRAVLDVLMRDWWQNGNTEGLRPRDVEDLRSMVVLSASLANDGSSTSPLARPVNQAVFRATLRANLEDWLANWNADGRDGPPQRN